MSRKGPAPELQGVEVALAPEELELDPMAMTQKYEEHVREQQAQVEKEDFSDMVAEHAAKQKVGATWEAQSDRLGVGSVLSGGAVCFRSERWVDSLYTSIFFEPEDLRDPPVSSTLGLRERKKVIQI